MDIRVGNGYDIHRTCVGRQLVLCGQHIPSDFGLLGHSDGDCIYHALSDALLGAIGERDIGFFFSDTEEQYKNIESKYILLFAHEQVKKAGYNIRNIDLTVIAPAPKLMQYIPLMKNNLHELLSMPISDIGLKAKTNNGVGDNQFIACISNVLIYRTCE